MKQGTTRALGVTAFGAVVAVAAAGSAAAAGPADAFQQVAANTETMSVEDSVLDLPGNAAFAAAATRGSLEEADATGPSGPVAELLGGVPVAGGALSSVNLPTDPLTQGGLPTDGLTQGGLPIGGLPL